MITPVAPASRRVCASSSTGAYASQITSAPRTRSGVMPLTQ
jgi:hypothetical protein